MKRNDVYIIHGTDYKSLTRQLLTAANLAEDIGDRNKKIGLKPNLVLDSHPSNGATTHSELLAGTVEYLQDHGFCNITIMESSWIGDKTMRAYHTTGCAAVCETYGVPFVDLQKDSSHTYDAKGLSINLCDAAASIDYMINIPVLKAHCQTTVTCALKNNKGVIPNSEKRRFHTLGLHKPIAHLNTIARNDFVLVDNICGDLEFEEGGNPVVMNRILGFKDPVLCDAFVCDCLGYSADDVPYIRMAEKLGVGNADTSKANLIYLNEDTLDATKIPMTRKISSLARFTAPKDACSACYGSLIHALDRIHESQGLPKKAPAICIGQGYKGISGEIGVGSCTSHCQKSLKGCPPKAIDIVAFLEENWI